MSTKLPAILALLKGARATATAQLSGLHHESIKPDQYAGQTRRYTPYTEADGINNELPPESKPVRLTAASVLAEFERVVARELDLRATVDATNLVARADVVVEGTVLLAQVPSTTLLHLEQVVQNWSTFLSKLPVRDGALTWTLDPDTGVYRSETIWTHRTQKMIKNHVKAPATDKHPAQVEVYNVDENVGRWETFQLSGALSTTERDALQRRARVLLDAVRAAREVANDVEAVDVRVAQPLLDYVLRGTTAATAGTAAPR